MVTSWHEFIGKCKSRVSAIARACYLGREHWKDKLAKEIEVLNAKLSAVEAECNAASAMSDRLSIERDEALDRVGVLEKKVADLQNQSIRLPEDPPSSGQQFGPSMMALCINLAREVGLRKSVRATKIFFRWLKVEQRIPTYQAIRTWMQRVGLNRTQDVKQKNDRIWIVDHSNQIGQDKCLTILSIEQSKLPKEGTPLKLKDMTMLDVIPSKNWNRDNVLKIYQRTAEKYGQPIAVISDGAVELREPVEKLEKAGETPLSIRDMKHFLANRFESLMSKDEAYQEFNKEMGQTRSSMQQTEISHLSPPVMRQKSRFMNMAPILRWASMALWQIDHPESDGRKGVSQERITEKLGWLKKFKKDVRRWNELQEVISAILTHTNNYGLKRGTATELTTIFNQLPQNQSTVSLKGQVIKFVQQYEQKLKRGQRLPMSSEILESSFAQYKMFEQFHARSGFTQAILAFPCLLKPTNASEVVRAFARTKVKDVKAWMDKHLPKTHDSRRQSAYREYRNQTRQTKKQNRATPLAATG